LGGSFTADSFASPYVFLSQFRILLHYTAR
jgi:hypothetical protein